MIKVYGQINESISFFMNLNGSVVITSVQSWWASKSSPFLDT